MNQLDWQNVSVAAVVVAAVAYLLFRSIALLSRRKKAGCGAGCSSCPSDKQTTTLEVGGMVSIEQLTATAKHLRTNYQDE